jgi:hypothetical protein
MQRTDACNQQQDFKLLGGSKKRKTFFDEAPTASKLCSDCTPSPACQSERRCSVTLPYEAGQQVAKAWLRGSQFAQNSASVSADERAAL